MFLVALLQSKTVLAVFCIINFPLNLKWKFPGNISKPFLTFVNSDEKCLMVLVYSPLHIDIFIRSGLHPWYRILFQKGPKLCKITFISSMSS